MCANMLVDNISFILLLDKFKWIQGNNLGLMCDKL